MLLLSENQIVYTVHLSNPNMENGFEDDFLVVKMTYDIAHGLHATLSAEAKKREISDQITHNDGLGDSLKEPKDYLPPLGKVDLIVHANAYAPNAKAAQEIICEINIDDYSKKIKVIGDRQYIQYNNGRSELSDPLPFLSKPIRAELAFGGENYNKNPFGRGYLYSTNQDPVDVAISEAIDGLGGTEETEENSIDLVVHKESDLDVLALEEKSVPKPILTTELTPNEIEFILNAPNLENPLDPFTNPYEAIETAGFFCQPIDWADKISNDEYLKVQNSILSDAISSEEESAKGFWTFAPSAFSCALNDQVIDPITANAPMRFVNMHTATESFETFFPSHHPRLFIASRDNNLKLQEQQLRQNTIIVDLLENTLVVVWKSRMKLSGVRPMEKDYNHKYAYIFFEESNENTSFDTVTKKFTELNAEFEQAEKIAQPITEEAFQEKFNEIKATLVDMGEDAEIDEIILKELSLIQSEKQAEKFFDQQHKKAMKDFEDNLKEFENFTKETFGDV